MNSNELILSQYDNPSLEVDLVVQAIMLSDEKMFVSPDGQRVYFLGNQPGVFLIRIDAFDQLNFNNMLPEAIRAHVIFRLREAGMENEIDHQGLWIP